MAKVVVSKAAWNLKIPNLFAGGAASVTSDALQQLLVSKAAWNRKIPNLFSGGAASVALQHLKGLGKEMPAEEDSAASADPRPERDSLRGDALQLKGLGKMGVPGDIYRFELRRYGFVSSCRSFSSTSDALDFADGSDGEGKSICVWDLSGSDGKEVYQYLGSDRRGLNRGLDTHLRLPPGALWNAKEYSNKVMLKVVVPGQGKDIMFNMLRLAGFELLILMEEDAKEDEKEDAKNEDEELEKGPCICFPADLFEWDDIDAELEDGVVTVTIPKISDLF